MQQSRAAISHTYTYTYTCAYEFSAECQLSNINDGLPAVLEDTEKSATLPNQAGSKHCLWPVPAALRHGNEHADDKGEATRSLTRACDTNSYVPTTKSPVQRRGHCAQCPCWCAR